MDKLKQIFSSVLGIDSKNINEQTSPGNTPSWDSLNAIILVTEIEKAFDMKFEFAEVMKVNNFFDVINLLKTKGIKLDE